MSIADTALKSALDPIIDIFIVPKLKEIQKRNKELDCLLNPDLEEHFIAYIKNRYTKCSYLRSVVFGSQSMQLTDIYTPLTLKYDTTLYTRNNQDKRFIMDTTPLYLLESYDRILIIDKAGMGKSTLLNWMFLRIVDEKSAYPILINLRSIDDKGIIRLFLDELKLINKELDEFVLRAMLDRGDFIIMLDGIDEIPFDIRARAIREINSLIYKAPNNKYILTSRPDEDVDSLVAGLTCFSFVPYTINEAKKLIEKYDISEDNENSKLFFDELSNSKNESHLAFIDNPFLTTLMWSSFLHNRTLSSEVHIFYQNIFDSLFIRHDKFKGDSFVHEKKSGLEQSQFELVLRYFSFETLLDAKTFYNYELLKEYLRKVKNALSLTFDIDNYIRDLVTNVSLFQQDGVVYQWCHKPLQDYFFAKYLCIDTGELKKQYLNDIYCSNRFLHYYNVLTIFKDMDAKSFDVYFTCNFLDDYLSHYMKTMTVIKSVNNRIASVLMFSQIKIIFVSDNSDVTLDINLDEYTKLCDCEYDNNFYHFYYLVKYNKERIYKYELISSYNLLAQDKKDKNHLIAYNIRHIVESYDEGFIYDINNESLLCLLFFGEESLNVDWILDYNKCFEYREKIKKFDEARKQRVF